MILSQASIRESILIKIGSKNIDRKNFKLPMGSKQVQIKSMKLYRNNMEILNDWRWTSGNSSFSASFEPCDSYKENF